MPRIKQVFLNIINNAVYAMKDGGSLTIRTTAGADKVHVAFQDTGLGIPADILGRIFDPFFTTKPEVSGTGLGLSVSLGIVQSHGGAVDVQSTPGKGSTFTIILPIKFDAGFLGRWGPRNGPPHPQRSARPGKAVTRLGITRDWVAGGAKDS